MSFIFCDESLHIGEQVEIAGRAAQHLRARRARVGELLELQTPYTERFVVEVVSSGRTYEVIPREHVMIRPVAIRAVTLVQPLIQEQALDLVLQKTTEVGVTHIRLYHADNSPHALKRDRIEHKLSRWNDILLSACEQSGRPTPPTLSLYESLSAALVDTPNPVFVGSEAGTDSLQSSDDMCTYVVGPEGGLTTKEQELLAGAKQVCFGPHTLRSETASIIGVAHLLLR